MFEGMSLGPGSCPSRPVRGCMTSTGSSICVRDRSVRTVPSFLILKMANTRDMLGAIPPAASPRLSVVKKAVWPYF